MQRKILHKSMGNSDIGVDMVLQKEKKKKQPLLIS